MPPIVRAAYGWPEPRTSFQRVTKFVPFRVSVVNEAAEEASTWKNASGRISEGLPNDGIVKVPSATVNLTLSDAMFLIASVPSPVFVRRHAYPESDSTV